MVDEKTIKMTIKRDPNQLSLFDADDKPQIYITTLKCQQVKRELDMFLIQKDNKYGLIDNYGEEVLPCEFDDIEVLSSDYFLATRKQVTKIYKRDGSPLKLDEQYHVCEHSCTTGQFLLRRLEGFEKHPKYALYSLQIKDYLAYWTSDCRNLGRLFFIRDEKYGNQLTFSSGGTEKVKKITHFAHSAMVEYDNKSFCIYDCEGKCVWKDKGF